MTDELQRLIADIRRYTNVAISISMTLDKAANELERLAAVQAPQVHIRPVVPIPADYDDAPPQVSAEQRESLVLEVAIREYNSDRDSLEEPDTVPNFYASDHLPEYLRRARVAVDAVLAALTGKDK